MQVRCPLRRLKTLFVMTSPVHSIVTLTFVFFLFIFSTDVVDAHGRTPLLVAASNGSIAICRMLVKNGANVNVASPSGGITPLMASIEHEHVDCAYVLMDELKADVHQRNSQVRTNSGLKSQFIRPYCW